MTENQTVLRHMLDMASGVHPGSAADISSVPPAGMVDRNHDVIRKNLSRYQQMVTFLSQPHRNGSGLVSALIDHNYKKWESCGLQSVRGLREMDALSSKRRHATDAMDRGDQPTTARALCSILQTSPFDEQARRSLTNILENGHLANDSDTMEYVNRVAIGHDYSFRHEILKQCTDIYVHNGTIYAHGHNTTALYAFSLEGDLLWEKELGLNDPRSIMAVSQETLLLCDRHNKRLLALDPNGTLRREIAIDEIGFDATKRYAPLHLSGTGDELFMVLHHPADSPETRMIKTRLSDPSAFEVLAFDCAPSVSYMAPAGNHLLFLDHVSGFLFGLDMTTQKVSEVFCEPEQKISRFCSDGEFVYVTTPTHFHKVRIDGLRCFSADRFTENIPLIHTLGCCLSGSGAGQRLLVLDPTWGMVHVFQHGPAALAASANEVIYAG